jgi:hypothetical protein
VTLRSTRLETLRPCHKEHARFNNKGPAQAGLFFLHEHLLCERQVKRGARRSRHLPRSPQFWRRSRDRRSLIATSVSVFLCSVRSCLFVV